MPSETSTACADQSVEELRRELAEAREQQAATAEILRVISGSPMDLQRVFAEIATRAARLCDTYDAVIRQVDGEELRLVAHHGPVPTPSTIPVSRNSVVGCAVIDRRTIHLADLQSEAHEYPESRNRAHQLGHRTALGVPLVRAGEAVGVILIRRTEVHPFTDRQIDLLKTFADQAVIAIGNTRLFEEIQARTKELQESLEYQSAIGDVLAVISRSPSNVQPVLDMIAVTAMRLCQSDRATIWRLEDKGHRLVAMAPSDETLKHRLSETIIPVDRSSVSGRVALDGRTVHVHDAWEDPVNLAVPELVRDTRRTIIGVPLLSKGAVTGVIILPRSKVEPFTERQIALVETFAEQAVIAIENARLFEAEQASKRELQESLEYQTATSEVLNVISRSPTELQPVLDAIAATAARLCESKDALVWRVAGGRIRVVAEFGSPTPASTLPLTRGSVTGRAIVDRKTIHVHDLAAMVETEYPDVKERQQRVGHRTALVAPLLSQGQALGAISVRRAHVHPFSARQIALLQTFADQAVIAIENTRLFEEVQTRNRELGAALEQQTATSEILDVISRSPGELESVFQAVLKSATQLCAAKFGTLYLREGSGFRAAAMHNAPRAFVEARAGILYPPPDTAIGQVAKTKRPAQIADVTVERPYVERDPFVVAFTALGGYRSVLTVPLLKEDELIGAISIYRQAVGSFADKEVELVTNFAAQAVIAIENTRLFEEVQARTRELTESLQQQTGTAEVLKVISRSAYDLESVLQTLVESAGRLCDADKGTITRQIDGVFYRAESYGFPAEVMERWRNVPVTSERGSAAGRALLEGRAVQVPDADADPDYTFDTAGARTMLGVPMLREGVPIGVLALARSDVRPFTAKQIDLVSTFADQAAIAIENVRLFEEVQARTRELAQTVEDLEIASQHKSQFVANMSHELRTPLAAILGYAELIQEGFYEPQGPKSLDALARIGSNGKHLLGLINTVLDIAKIESGQFTLNMAEYAIESVVETVRSATESLAQNKKLALRTEVAKSLPIGLGDEQRLTQVLLNLVGNAIKFTDTGEVCVTAKAVNGHFSVSVTDTGPGILAEHQTRIFEQFHQVDSSNTKAKGGTGLGLAIAKQIVEMHGGRIWVESTLGKGSTFQMELPTRAELRKPAS